MTAQNSLEASIKNLDAKIMELDNVIEKINKLYETMNKGYSEAKKHIDVLVDNVRFIKAYLMTESAEKQKKLERFLRLLIVRAYEKKGKKARIDDVEFILNNIYSKRADYELLAIIDELLGPQ